MKLVLIKWKDSRFIEGWHDKIDLELINPAKCASIGILIKDEDYSIMIASHISENRVAGIISIPKSAIEKYWELKVKVNDKS